MFTLFYYKIPHLVVTIQGLEMQIALRKQSFNNELCLPSYINV